MDPGPPPAGGDENHGPGLLAEYTIFLFVSINVVVLRFIARVKSKGIGLDDYLMLAALVQLLLLYLDCETDPTQLITITDFGVTIEIVRLGLGRHLYYLTSDIPRLVRLLELNFISELLSLQAICCVKLSVAFLILRIGGLNKWLRSGLIATIVIQVSSTLAFTLVLLVQCRPITANWNLAIKPTADCIPMAGLIDSSYATTATSILTDFSCALLPFPIVWNLQMPRKRKAYVLGLLFLAVFPGICGILRLVHVADLSGSDITFDIIPLAEWGFAEVFLGIIFGSIPPCRALLLRIMAKWRGKSVPDEENTLGARAPKSGRTYLFSTLSRISKPFSQKSRLSRSTKNSDWQRISRDNTHEYSGQSRGSTERLEPIPLGLIKQTSA
ncbi:hypothetical protein MMC14_001897 [Varicellaria rhodocarpa]|nr:hypothetical protein [Varicellaria rhodocarpa]